VDNQGRVVGVVTAKRTNAEAIGLAVAADHVEALLAGRQATAVAPPAPGVAPPVPGVVPPATGLPRSAAGGPPTAEVQREIGTRRFEQTLAEIAQQVASAAEGLNAYSRGCPGHPAVVIASDGSASVPGGGMVAGIEHPDCVGLRRRILAIHETIHDRLAEAEEEARRAGAYPGTIRDLRRKYRLDWE
jgi:hypothetical protein